jgi:16S rRNA (guanine1207-N2)-methyltransferase
MSHYYKNDPNLKHHIRTHEMTLFGHVFRFKTDAGVFSKGHLDEGTKALIEAIPHQDYDIVIDMGCGYGPVSVILSKILPKTHFIAYDPNERAVTLTLENAQLNNASNIEAFVSALLPPLHEKVDLVISNPPIRAGKQVMYHMFEEAHEALKDNGSLWIVIQKKHGAESAIKFLMTLFDDVKVISKHQGYRIIKATKH